MLCTYIIEYVLTLFFKIECFVTDYGKDKKVTIFLKLLFWRPLKNGTKTQSANFAIMHDMTTKFHRNRSNGSWVMTSRTDKLWAKSSSWKLKLRLVLLATSRESRAYSTYNTIPINVYIYEFWISISICRRGSLLFND